VVNLKLIGNYYNIDGNLKVMVMGGDVGIKSVFFLFIYSHVDTSFGSFLPPPPPPSPPLSLTSRQNLFCPYL
jgi:hypothetical protein